MARNRYLALPLFSGKFIVACVKSRISVSGGVRSV